MLGKDGKTKCHYVRYVSIIACSLATTSGFASAKLLCSVGSAVILNK
jgi:hypothetical protein